MSTFTLKERCLLGRIVAKVMEEKGDTRTVQISLTTPEQVELPALLTKIHSRASMVEDFKPEFLKQKEYSIALEHDRSGLWGVNQELREKIAALEKGQEDLIQLLHTQDQILIRGVPPPPDETL